MTVSTPVLIVAYRRSENLKAILDQCVKQEIGTIYVNLDGPRFSDHEVEVSQCREVIYDFQRNFSGDLHVSISQRNDGSAVSVLKSCDWIFKSEEFAIILEDDCIPGEGFFDFVEDSKVILSQNDKIFSVSGTQFAPQEITCDVWSLSRYPLFWGWATSRSQWILMRNELSKMNLKNDKRMFSSYSEYCFWKSGTRRSLNGFVDAWDLPLLFSLARKDKLHLHPGVNLIRNIGVDVVATHTTKANPWIGRETGNYVASRIPPAVNQNLNKWLYKNFYKISTRHILTTKLTALLDQVRLNKKLRSPLSERWK